MVMAAKPCVFLDRDGVIVVPEFRDGRSFAPKTLESFHYFPAVHEMLSRLKERGYWLVVVTNQPDVGNGLLSQSVVECMHEKMRIDLPIDHVEVCYHRQQDNCDCRKPRPGMLHRACQVLDIDMGRSVVIGDRSSDIELGKQFNLTTIFIDHRYHETLKVSPDCICQNLSQGVEFVLASRLS